MLRRVRLDGSVLSQRRLPEVGESAIRALSEAEIAGVRPRRIGELAVVERRVLVLRLRLIVHFLIAKAKKTPTLLRFPQFKIVNHSLTHNAYT